MKYTTEELAELAFKCLVKSNKPRDMFPDDHCCICWINKWKGYAFTLLQAVTNRHRASDGYIDLIKQALTD